MSFTSQINKFADKANNEANKVVRGTALGMFSKIVLRTPVGKPSIWKRPNSAPAGYTGGRLRGNWQITLHNPALDTVDAIDKSGSSTISDGNNELMKVDGDMSIYFTNNLPYAKAVEDGHSQQARPVGMVAATVADYQSILRDNL